MNENVDWTRRAAWTGIADGYWPRPPVVIWYDDFRLVRVWFRPAERTYEVARWQQGAWKVLARSAAPRRVRTPEQAREVALALLAEHAPREDAGGAVSNPVGVRRDGRLVTVRR